MYHTTANGLVPIAYVYVFRRCFVVVDHQVFCVNCKMHCITADKARSFGAPNSRVKAPVPSSTENNTLFLRSKSTLGGIPEDTGRDLADAAKSTLAASAAAKEQAREAADARMGEKLLLGWTMLADVCPTPWCCFPLMLDKEGDVNCVSCGGDGFPAETETIPEPSPSPSIESTYARPSAGTAASTSSTTPVPSPNVTEIDGGGLVSEEEFAAVRKKRDRLSASLGTYMLQGWVLLDKTCPREECEPGTPLLKDRNTGMLYCAGCDTRMSEGGRGGSVANLAGTASSSKMLPVKRDSSGGDKSLGLAVKGVGTTRTAASKVNSLEVYHGTLQQYGSTVRP